MRQAKAQSNANPAALEAGGMRPRRPREP